MCPPTFVEHELPSHSRCWVDAAPSPASSIARERWEARTMPHWESGDPRRSGSVPLPGHRKVSLPTCCLAVGRLGLCAPAEMPGAGAETDSPPDSPHTQLKVHQPRFWPGITSVTCSQSPFDGVRTRYCLQWEKPRDARGFKAVGEPETGLLSWSLAGWSLGGRHRGVMVSVTEADCPPHLQPPGYGFSIKSARGAPK